MTAQGAKTIDLEPLRQVFRAINADPSIHNQSFWGLADKNPAKQPACKTAFCIAGHLAINDGWAPVWEEASFFNANTGKWSQHWTFSEVEKGDRMDSVDNVGADLIVPDWDDDDSRELIDDMFAGTNTPAEIQALAEDLAERAGEELGVVLLPDHPSHKVD